MDLEAQFSSSAIEQMILVKTERMEAAALSRLERIGEKFIELARSNGAYMDRTGNLRSSIGYVILKNGEQYSSGGFAKVKEGATGIATGEAFLEEISRNYPTGLVIIGVAGMSYAAHVEDKGRDVISGSALIVKADLKKAIEALKHK